jgi:outer membrane protein OmpA-like peptidoglycan-associated protein
MKIFIRLSYMVILGLFPLLMSGQEQVAYKAPDIFRSHFTIQGNCGLTEYFGDLNRDDWFNSNVKLGYGGILGYQFTPVFGLRGQFVKGELFSAHSAKLLKLKTDFWDAGMHITLNINEIFAKYNSHRFMNFYLFGGVGMTSFTSVVTQFNNIEVIKSDSRQNEIFIPMGAGTSLKMGKKVTLNLEYGDHLTLKDETLDLTKSAKSRDQYSYASAGIEVSFGGPRDRDHDGVKDKKDLCPGVAGKYELSGCPDADNDSIPDGEDACPKIAGKLEFKGCPDTDGDGIPDKEDACPDAAGIRDLKGCPDKDHDGIADKDDKCPDAAGKKEFNGCPDIDGDGIADINDKCPDIAGLPLLGGCPDKDNDGIADYQDKCPGVAGTLANGGCPEESKVFVDEVVYFNTDEYIVIAKYNQLLNKIAETMRDNPGIRVTVDGHTDSRESKMYNMRLSENRADYVYKFFTERGIDPQRLVKRFFGESKPAASNMTPEGMTLNRRVEISSIK